MQSDNGQNSTAPRFCTFPFFFSQKTVQGLVMLQIHHTCNLKVDKTQLPQDFALFYTFFAEYCIRSGEDAKTSYMQPKSGQNSTAPRFCTFPYFFLQKTAQGVVKTQKRHTCNLKMGKTQLHQDFALFCTFFCQRLYSKW